MDKPLSYAQNLEDVHIALAFGEQPRGFYVDVGAGHPVADNVTLCRYLAGWSGVVVEPQERLASLYAAIRPRDVALSCLVGRAAGEAAFHEVDRLHGFSTMVESHARGAEAFGAGYSSRMMRVTTLAEICARHAPGAVDLVKIDVEGAEKDVLEGADWARFRPRLLVIEAMAPGSGEPAWAEWEPALLAQGYVMALFDGLNRFYAAADDPAIAQRLAAAPVAWDSVRHMYEFGRAGSQADHPDHALARRLARGLWASLPRLDPALLRELLAAAGEDMRDEGSRTWKATPGGWRSAASPWAMTAVSSSTSRRPEASRAQASGGSPAARRAEARAARSRRFRLAR